MGGITFKALLERVPLLASVEIENMTDPTDALMRKQLLR